MFHDETIVADGEDEKLVSSLAVGSRYVRCSSRDLNQNEFHSSDAGILRICYSPVEPGCVPLLREPVLRKSDTPNQSSKKNPHYPRGRFVAKHIHPLPEV